MTRPDNASPEPAYDSAASTSVTPSRSASESGRNQWMVVGGLLVALGLVIGGSIGYAIGHHSGHDRRFPARPGLAGFGQRGEMPGQYGGGVFGGRGSSVNAIRGTVSATSSSTLTVKTASGSTEYAVTSATHIVRGAKTAKLSDLKSGDPVLVVLGTAISSGKPVASQIVAGTGASAPLPAGRGGPGLPGGPRGQVAPRSR